MTTFQTVFVFSLSTLYFVMVRALWWSSVRFDRLTKAKVTLPTAHLSKVEIKEQKLEFLRNEETAIEWSHPTAKSKKVTYKRAGKMIGFLEFRETAVKNIWEAIDIECSEKGKGRLLVYDAMSNIYPDFLLVDRGTVSSKGERLWRAFNFVPFVQTIDAPLRLTVRNNTPTGGLNTMHRFAWYSSFGVEKIDSYKLPLTIKENGIS